MFLRQLHNKKWFVYLFSKKNEVFLDKNIVICSHGSVTWAITNNHLNERTYSCLLSFSGGKNINKKDYWFHLLLLLLYRSYLKMLIFLLCWKINWTNKKTSTYLFCSFLDPSNLSFKLGSFYLLLKYVRLKKSFFINIKFVGGWKRNYMLKLLLLHIQSICRLLWSLWAIGNVITITKRKY